MKKEFSDIQFEMFIMPFGKHKNKTIPEIPASYMLWIVDQDFCPEVLKAYIELNEEEIHLDAEEEESFQLYDDTY